MKVRKSKRNSDFINSLLNCDELSYEDYLKLKKIEELYNKAKNKYKKQSTKDPKDIYLEKIKNTLDKSNKDKKFDNYDSFKLNIDDMFKDDDLLCYDDFIPEDSPGYNRARNFSMYMNNLNTPY